MAENMNLIASLVWLRRLGADEQNPQDSFRQGFVRAPGLVERCGDRAYLTPDGWDLAERMIAAAETQLVAYHAADADYYDARAGSSFLDAARAEGLLVGTYGGRKPTDLGRKTWTDFLRRLGLPGDGSKPEPEPEPTLTESADGRRDWLLNGNRHRDDGPAIEWPDGRRDWWLHGKRHREDGPAIELPDGRREWWLHGKRHREDGPAIEWPNGCREWRLNGVLHREDGPAIEWPNGCREWFLNGVRQPEPDKGGRQ